MVNAWGLVLYIEVVLYAMRKSLCLSVWILGWISHRQCALEEEFQNRRKCSASSVQMHEKSRSEQKINRARNVVSSPMVEIVIL